VVPLHVRLLKNKEAALVGAASVGIQAPSKTSQ